MSLYRHPIVFQLFIIVRHWYNMDLILPAIKQCKSLARRDFFQFSCVTTMDLYVVENWIKTSLLVVKKMLFEVLNNAMHWSSQHIFKVIIFPLPILIIWIFAPFFNIMIILFGTSIVKYLFASHHFHRLFNITWFYFQQPS